MIDAVLSREADFPQWRERARALLAGGVPPERVAWRVDEAPPDLFALADEVDASVEGRADVEASAPRVSRRFVDLAETVVCHAAGERFALLYRMLWRMTRGGEPELIDIASDPLVARLSAMAASVRRDLHKMKAFVRFREVAGDDGPVYVAWFEPQHHILERVAPFFVARFTGMRWSILTPAASAHWDGQTLHIAPGAARPDAPGEDAFEDLWRRYYASIFNPARLKLQAMRAQMPVKYWAQLPEARLIAPLARAATTRTQAMLGAAPSVPRKRTPAAAVPPAAPASPPDPPGGAVAEGAVIEGAAGALDALRGEAARCRACPLWEPATQTVFGEGPASARVVLVGEQPGDQEDLQGRPFVGPAGTVFDRALADAGVDRSRVYITNAVKHFKFVVRGKRRLHQKPHLIEIGACHPWLERELEVVRPALVVALGATAARALLGRDVTISRVRGAFIDGNGRRVLVTVHPSFLLRLPDEAARQEEYRRFVADLALLRPFVAAAAPAG